MEIGKQISEQVRTETIYSVPEVLVKGHGGMM